MEIVVYRQPSKEESTRGELYIDGDAFCDTLEDEKREIKVSGETRIPSGRYPVVLNERYDEKGDEDPTPMTKKYRSKFDWFLWHIQVMNVPGFSNIYIHIGNYESNTDGCLLLGTGFEDYDKESAIWHSGVTYEEFYKTVVPLLNNGEDVWITYVDHELDQ